MRTRCFPARSVLLALAPVTCAFSTAAAPAVSVKPTVKVATVQADATTTYFYRIVNTSIFRIRGFAIGLSEETDEALLDVAPLSATAPAGWTGQVVRTEEEARWHAIWFNPEVGIAPGAALAGFALTTPALSQSYQQATYSVFYGPGAVSGPVQAEGAVVPGLVCVTPLAGGAFNAYFTYKNNNAAPVEITVGPANFFSAGAQDPDPQNRGQPTTFEPGDGAPPFVVQSSGAPLTWTVEGRSAVATTTGTPCVAPQLEK